MCFILAWRGTNCKREFGVGVVQSFNKPAAAGYTAHMYPIFAGQAVSLCGLSRRRWPQFRLRTLLVVVALLGLVCSGLQHLLASYEAEWRQEELAIAEVKSLFEYSITVTKKPHGPAWLRALVPVNRRWMFDRVECIGFVNVFKSDRSEIEQWIQHVKDSGVFDFNFVFPTDRRETDRMVLELMKLAYLQRLDRRFLIFSPPDRAEVDVDAMTRALPSITINLRNLDYARAELRSIRPERQSTMKQSRATNLTSKAV